MPPEWARQRERQEANVAQAREMPASAARTWRLMLFMARAQDGDESAMVTGAPEGVMRQPVARAGSEVKAQSAMRTAQQRCLFLLEYAAIIS